MQTRSDDLIILLSVADNGNFSAAADALDIQIAKVSRAIARIEKQLGVSLFNRTTRKMEVTEEGKSFIQAVRDGLHIIEQAEEEVQSSDNPKGHLRVDAASPFVLHQLVPLVYEFNQLYPEIRLTLTSNEGYVDLLEKRTDVAIRIGNLTDSTLHARLLGKSPLHIVASPEYFKKHGMPKTVAELAKHQLIGFNSPKILNEWPLTDMQEMIPAIEVSSGETMRQLALEGNGIGCLSGFMVNEDMASGRLVPVLSKNVISNTPREHVYAVYYKSSTLSKRISVFLDFIQPRLRL